MWVKKRGGGIDGGKGRGMEGGRGRERNVYGERWVEEGRKRAGESGGETVHWRP